MASKRVCSVQGCGKPFHAQGLCKNHYQHRWQQAQTEPCSVDGCNRPRRGRGLCAMHHKRWKKHGTTDPSPSPTRLCSVSVCSKRHYGHGYCRPHWKRYLRHGDPIHGHRPKGEALRYFHEVVLRYDGDDCLFWPFNRNKKSGHGIVNFDGRKQIVHRMVCSAKHGPPPEPHYETAHSCGNGHKGCVAPRHLRWATSKENHADKLIHGTHNRGTNNYSTRLSEANVREIRASASAGVGASELAKRFGVSSGAVYGILYGRSWSWLK